jgi:hypothetical protein
MSLRMLHAAAIGSLLIAAACGSSGNSSSTPAIALHDQSKGEPAYVEVTGLSSSQLRAVRSAALTDAQWSSLFRVAVSDTSPGMLGTYSVTDDALRFAPQFALDAGRPYVVRFDPAHLPGTGTAAVPAIVATVTVPAKHVVPSTTVARVYPSADTVPENLLRMYVEFSGPMGRPSGIPHMKLLGADGREIDGAFLPLDYEFWDPDHTRFTAFLDPGRVKSGILPNKQMGRALDTGRTVTLAISREWRDEHGLPLKDEYRRVFRVAAPADKPIDPASWRIEPPPAAGNRNALTVSFPRPLDHALLMRAIGVTRGDISVAGDVTIEGAETRWVFTPREPWRGGQHHLLVLDILEDVAGNQIGRAFEVDKFDTVDKSPNPQRIMIPFTVDTAVIN